MKHRTSRVAPLLVSVVAWTAPASAVLAQQPPASATKAQELGAEFDALRQRFDTALEAHRSELNALYSGYDEEHASADEQAALEKRRAELDAVDPTPGFVKEFVALAERARGTDVAAKALMQVFEHDRTSASVADNPGRKALATLLAEHIRSPAVEELPTLLQYASSIDAVTRTEAYKKLASDSPFERVQAGALFALAIDLTVDQARGGDHAQARRMLVDLATRFGALATPYGKTYAALAEGFVYELDHLQLGMHAPDFEATDADGVKFKLSEYSGKVVVVDFWGNW